MYNEACAKVTLWKEAYELQHKDCLDMKKKYKDLLSQRSVTMEQITVNMENLNDSEREQLLAIIEKTNKPKDKVWKPEICENYYFIGSTNEVFKSSWSNCHSDKMRYILNNAFKTREEAEFEAKHREIRAELERFALKHNESETDWNNDCMPKYYIVYNHHFDRFDVYLYNWAQLSKEIFFTSEEVARKAIDYIGEENIRKYYFKIKER